MHLAIVTLVAFFASSPLLAILPSARLAIEFAPSPPYRLAAKCDLSQPIVVLNVVVQNSGRLANEPSAGNDGIVATDAAGTLGGGVALPAIEPGDFVNIALPLRRLGATPAAALVGTHNIIVSIGAVRSASLAVPIPGTLCAPVAVVPTPKPTTTLPPIVPVSPTPTPKPNGSLVLKNPNRSALLFAATPKPGQSLTTTKKGIDLSKVFTIAAPKNLKSAASLTDCGAHAGLIGALFCPDMVKSGNLLLIWDWQPGDGPDDIDGYRVYRVDQGSQLVGTQDKKDLTFVDVPKPAGNDSSYYGGKCYAVSAYSGTRKSALSPPFCAGAGSAAATVRLSANDTSTSSWYKACGGYERHISTHGSMTVGFSYAEKKAILGDSCYNYIYRGGVVFDVSSLRGQRLVSAQLKLGISESKGSGNYSCAEHIGTGVDSWWQHDGWLGGSFGGNVTPINVGPVVTADVTAIVASWMRGEPNYGFVLQGPDENLNAFTDAICTTTYINPQLVVIYF